MVNFFSLPLKMVQAEWFLQGYVLHSDLKVLGLQHFYMVIGMDWLKKILPYEDT
jgi:hypothetical protein